MKPTDQALDDLFAVREPPLSAEQLQLLLRTLKSGNHYRVQQAARLVGRLQLADLAANLVAAFERMRVDGTKSDPQCQAKTALIEALISLGFDDAAFFRRGMATVQRVFQHDAAAPVRSLSAMALVHCSLPEMDVLEALVDLLDDTERKVRAGVVRAMAQIPSRTTALVLRTKLSCGDVDAEVVGECCAALLDIDAVATLPLVAKMVRHPDEEVRAQAIAVLGLCREPLSVATLIACWKSAEDPDNQEQIMQALGNSRHPPARTFLLELIADEDGSTNVAAAALNALSNGLNRDLVREQVRTLVEERGHVYLSRLFEQLFEQG